MNKRSGYTDRILKVDLSNRSFSEVNIEKINNRYIGGRGVASYMYWREIPKEVKAFDPENHLYFINGPLCGTVTPGSSRWIVAGKSPMAVPDQYATGNLGGHFGVCMKWAGLDGINITGKSDKPVMLVIEGYDKYTLEDASFLWGKDTAATIAAIQSIYGAGSHVITIGRAGEQLIRFANIIGSSGISATKGFGAVMGAKNLKAVVIIKQKKNSIELADPENFKKLLKKTATFWKGKESGRYWNDLFLEDIEKVKNVLCFGCPGVCRRGIYKSDEHSQGYRKGCVSAYFYCGHENEKTGRMGGVTFHATQLSNLHGLCILEFLALNRWLPRAIEEGFIDSENEGLFVDDLGTKKWIDTLVGMIVNRRGLGDILSEGSRRAADKLGCSHLLEGTVNREGFISDAYNPRLFLSTAPMYATEPVFPITQLHEVSFPMVRWMIWMATEGSMSFLSTEKLRKLAEVFWGDVKAAEFDSPSAMGSASVRMQNRAYAKENMVLCDWLWPLHYTGNTESGIGDPSLEAKFFSAVTGIEMDETGYLLSGERISNLCRAIYLKEGRQGRVDDVLDEFNFSEPLSEQPPPVGLFNPELMMPGKNGELFSRKGSVVERGMFNTIMDEYYMARGWDVATGLFKRKCLEITGLDDITEELDKNGLIVD